MRPLKVYLAARYSRREEMVDYAAELFKYGGHVVTSRWLLGEHQWNGAAAEVADQYERQGLMAPAAIGFAQDDLDDLDQADMLVCFPETPRVPSTSRGGVHVEFGYALAANKPTLTVGPQQNVFHLLVPNYPSWDEALEAIWVRGLWAAGLPRRRECACSGNEPADACPVHRAMVVQP